MQGTSPNILSAECVIKIALEDSPTISAWDMGRIDYVAAAKCHKSFQEKRLQLLGITGFTES